MAIYMWMHFEHMSLYYKVSCQSVKKFQHTFLSGYTTVIIVTSFTTEEKKNISLLDQDLKLNKYNSFISTVLKEQLISMDLDQAELE